MYNSMCLTRLHIHTQVGTRLQKFFDGECYAGTVVSSDVCKNTGKKMWHVRYDDGDEEDLFEEEIEPLLFQSSECVS